MTQEQTQEQPDRHIMTVDEMREHEWIVSWSGGKDSTATIILMHEHNIPIKKIVYVRMMFDETTPATLPIMTDFIERGAEQFRRWGYTLERIDSIKTAMELAQTIYKRSKYSYSNGNPYGISAFMRGCCWFTTIKQKTITSNCNFENEYRMIGYSATETKRIARLGGKHQSIMYVLNVSTKQAFEICRKYDLLSPVYALGIKRDGCFFCPNCKKKERDILKQTRPDLVEHIHELIRMSSYNIDVIKNKNNWIVDYLEEQAQNADPHKQSKLSDF